MTYQPMHDNIASVGRNWKCQVKLILQCALYFIRQNIAILEKLGRASFKFVIDMNPFGTSFDVVLGCIQEKKKLEETLLISVSIKQVSIKVFKPVCHE